MIEKFSKVTGVSITTLLGRKKTVRIVDYRHVYWYLLRKAGMSFCDIASISRVTHASVLYGVNRVTVLLGIRNKRITDIYNATKHLAL
jgi:chromosomal replication initiation ATPase DnaA